MYVRSSLLLIILITSLLTFQTKSTLIDDFLAVLPESDAEIDQVIVKEFIQEQHSATDVKGLMQQFAVFKKSWTEKMVQFLIRELQINEEGASEARKNPDSFYINFDTYKLFRSF